MIQNQLSNVANFRSVSIYDSLQEHNYYGS